MLINYSNLFAGYITCFPQLKGTILDRLAPNFEKPRNKKFGGLPLAWHISFMSNTSSNIFLSKFGSKTIAFSCQWSFSGKNPLFCLFLGQKCLLVKNLGFAWGLPHFFYLLYISYSYFCQNFGQKPLPFPANWNVVEEIHFFVYFWVKIIIFSTHNYHFHEFFCLRST